MESPRLVVLAQQNPDLRREAGLRGAELEQAVWRLAAVFVVAMLLLAVVLFVGRRRKRSE